MIDAAEDRERFQKLLHELEPAPAAERHRAHRTRSAGEGRRRWAIRWWCARATCWAAARWKSCTSSATSSATCARRSRSRNDSPVLLDRFLNDAIEVRRRLLCATARRTFIGGVMEHIEQAGVHSGDSACSLPPYSLSQATIDELKRQTAADGQGAERGRPDERAVRDPGEGRQGRDLRARSQPARLAHRALRVQGDRHPAGQGRGALHGRPVAGSRRASRRKSCRRTSASRKRCSRS